MEEDQESAKTIPEPEEKEPDSELIQSEIERPCMTIEDNEVSRYEEPPEVPQLIYQR